MSGPHGDGGPAFPVTLENVSDRNITSYDGTILPPGAKTIWAAGMSLRDYIATQAMAAMIGHITAHTNPRSVEEMPTTAYQMADMMIRARAK
jgi:hypothetical protein